jgi:predicted alpha/beta-hydrolase family hydrolase
LPEASIREFADTAADPAVRGFLHTPESPSATGLVLMHSAGGNAQAPLLRVLADTYAAVGFMVLRCNLPFRQARSFGPPGPGDAARDRAGLKNAVAALKKTMKETVGAPLLVDFAKKSAVSLSKAGNSSSQGSEKIFLGGHSYGGRQSSMLCAEESDLVAGLLLLSYPLHPPRRPEQQRTQHLPDLHTPTLFVHGTRDPFGSIEELQRAMKMIPARTSLLTVESAGHDLGFKGKTKEADLPAIVLTEFQSFVD